MRYRKLKLTAAATAAGLLCAYTLNGSGLIDWQYYGTPTKAGAKTYDSDGVPTILEYSKTMPASLPVLPTDLQSKIAFLLPEGKDIRTNQQGLVPDSDGKTNISFTKDADVYVTFLSEGAGYRNAVGYFIYDTLNPPQKVSDVKEQVIFTNASAAGSGGSLDSASATKQNTVHLPTLKAGQSLGFFIASDGYNESGRLFNGSRTNGVKDSQSPKWIFYTLRALNPEASNSKNLNVHTVMLKDLTSYAIDYQRIVLGFEDINRESGGDHDFNDVILAVHVTPKTAIDTTNLNQIAGLVSATDPDTDGDGVKDSLDEFPNDKTRAFSQYYPDANTFGTLAFEDQWPTYGDYDLNDVVMRYRSRLILNASRQVVDVVLNYRLEARGASEDSGFGINLPGISKSLVASAKFCFNSATSCNDFQDNTAVATSVEAGQTEATFIVAPNLAKDMASVGSCFGNTQAACPTLPSVTYDLKLTFTTPQDLSKFSAPFNPFIFSPTQRGKETHLPGHAPTTLADKTLFGTKDDRTVVGTASSYYMDKDRRPWALDIPGNWKWPLERVDITAGYPNFVNWAKSSGTTYTDWYLTGTVPANLYTPK
jgi:LruC domain-containing protein